MRASNPNIQTQSSSTAEDLFTDREKPREVFWNTYNAMQPGDVEVISFYGVGGIGKSALLKKLGKEIEKKVKNGKLDYVYYSFESEPSKAEFLYSLSRKLMLRNKGLKFNLFDTAIAKIEEDGNKEISYLKDTGNNIFSTEAAGLLTAVASEFLPFVSATAKAMEQIVKLSNRMQADWQKEKGPRRNDYIEMSYKDSKAIIEKLHEYFRKDAFEVFENRAANDPMVILLDGYEHFVNRIKDGSKADFFDSWMYCDDTGLIYLPNTIWVIAGRDKLNWPLEILPPEKNHRMGRLSEEDSLAFLEKAGVYDKELAKQLYTLTTGTPAFLDLCVETYRHVINKKQPVIADFGNNVDSLAKRYLENMNSEKQKILEMITFLPNVWDMDMCVEIAKRLGYGDIYITLSEELLPLSIFEKEMDGYKLHETVRSVIKKKAAKAQEITKTILLYYKEMIFDNAGKISTLRVIELFCKYLDKYTKKWQFDETVITEKEIIRIKDILEKEKDRMSEYWICDKLINSIIAFCETNRFSPEVVISCHNLRNFNMYYMGKYKEGFEPARDTCEYARKVLGDNHPETLMSLYNLASSYNDQGNDEMAATLYERCLSLRVKLYGEKNVDVVRTMNNLAFAYENLAEEKSEPEYIQKAFELRKKCYEIRLEISGEDDQNTLKCMNNLAISYALLGIHDKAYELRKKCYEIRLAKFGPHHLDTLNSMYSYAESEREMGNYAIANELYHNGYSLRCERYGKTNPKTLECIPGYAKNLFAMGQHQEALSMIQKCYDDSLKVLSEGHIFSQRCEKIIKEFKELLSR